MTIDVGVLHVGCKLKLNGQIIYVAVLCHLVIERNDAILPPRADLNDADLLLHLR